MVLCEKLTALHLREQTLVGAQRGRFLRRVAFCLCSCLAAGCGPERPPVYPVKGQLFWNGQPAAGATVFLHAVTAKEVTAQSPTTERPYGRVQADGSFAISTFGKSDGAPVGQYRVTALWTKRTGPSEDDEESLLPAELMDANRSGLPMIEVRAGANVLPPFKLGQ
jgi:hypothetical protein